MVYLIDFDANYPQDLENLKQPLVSILYIDTFTEDQGESHKEESTIW
jgi:hypothetical protein